ANVPEHPPPSTRLMSCAHIANRRLSRIIGARQDWDVSETSWNFSLCPWLNIPHCYRVEDALSQFAVLCNSRLARMSELEESNNLILNDMYGMQSEITASIPQDRIVIYRPNRAEDIKRLLSYVIGCMMG